MYLMKRLITIILTTILVIPAFAAEDVRDLLVQKFEQTDYHNLPLINGTAQVYGSEFRSKNASVKGQVVVVNMGKAALLKFPQGMTPSVETINLDDPRFSNVWGDSIRRISFCTADNAPTKGSYVFSITELY